MNDYYIKRKGSLLRSFDRAIGWWTGPLVTRYGEEISQAIAGRARREFEQLLPDIPFIGGSRNHWTSDLMESAQCLALYRAMQAFEKPIRETADVIYEGMRIRLDDYPRILLRLMGRLQFSWLFLRLLQRMAKETQKQNYPGSFVAELVPGDGKEFDWGIDFKACSIHAFYVSHQASEFLPYVCRLDYITSAAFGLGLVRTKTLAEGDEVCNPRMKRGRATLWVQN